MNEKIYYKNLQSTKNVLDYSLLYLKYHFKSFDEGQWKSFEFENHFKSSCFISTNSVCKWCKGKLIACETYTCRILLYMQINIFYIKIIFTNINFNIIFFLMNYKLYVYEYHLNVIH